MNGTNGGEPQGSLTLYGNKFYGMTLNGGANSQGVIFEWDPATNIYTKKIDFTCFNGSNPSGSLTLNGGKFYGMTSHLIFEWDPVTNIYTKKIDFDGTNGGNTYGSLTLSDGKFYGMTSDGGANNKGVVLNGIPQPMFLRN